MKLLFNLKSSLLLILFGMTIMTVSAQRDVPPTDKNKVDCQKVEWYAKNNKPQLSNISSDCLSVTLVGFDKDQVEIIANTTKTLSNEFTQISISDDRKELRIELNSKKLNDDERIIEFENCFVEITKRL